MNTKPTSSPPPFHDQPRIRHQTSNPDIPLLSVTRRGSLLSERLDVLVVDSDVLLDPLCLSLGLLVHQPLLALLSPLGVRLAGLHADHTDQALCRGAKAERRGGGGSKSSAES